jgi:hypothetical protein
MRLDYYNPKINLVHLKNMQNFHVGKFLILYHLLCMTYFLKNHKEPFKLAKIGKKLEIHKIVYCFSWQLGQIT